MEQLENKAPPHEEQILNMEKTQTTADIDDGGILDCHAQDVGVESSKTVLRALCKFNSRRSNDSLQENTFAAPRESCLDPKSLDFRPSERARAIARLIQGHGISLRSAGICFHNLNVYGFGVESSYQKDVANVWFSLFSKLRTFTGHGRQRVNILRQFDGLVRKGEMLVVLGPPGSGCSTLLKTIAGETNGVHVSRSSYFNYQGITAKEMHSHHRGEAIYAAETDVHYPTMTVGDTLSFAACARVSRHLVSGLGKTDLANHLRDVVMAMFGISHTIDTPVGNDFVRGISGGERKRVTICEAVLSGSPIQCWNNATRGLDSLNAIDFCKNLRLGADMFHTTVCVSMYQSPQIAFDQFDKVTVLYEGQQIFFGRINVAKQYFIDLGFECPPRQTTPDFLTSMTAPGERVIRSGFERTAPRTSEQFTNAWQHSSHYKALQTEIEQYKTEHPIIGPDAEAFRGSKQAQQAKAHRRRSPYILSFSQQTQLCLWRGWRQLISDPGLTIGALVGNLIMALIVGSVFYNLNQTSSSFFQRGALIFFACILNAFASALEILGLFAKRPIVEKHGRYALYHPAAEAVASMICDLPYKIINSILFNTTLYFLTGLKREPGAFFFFLLVSFATVLVMSMIFRTIGSASRSLFRALVPAGILMLDLIIFTGFVLPKRYMLGWCGWLHYLDPLAYAFEALIVNEFHNRKFGCGQFVPNRALSQYAHVSSDHYTCQAVGAKAGQDFVLGDDYVGSNFDFSWGNRWRNLGIVLAFVVVLLLAYILTVELVSEKRSKGEVLVFRRGRQIIPAESANEQKDIEAAASDERPPVTTKSAWGRSGEAHSLQQRASVFQWRDICYDITIKKKARRILDRVDGWVKPGTLTALMGVSGAGKTTLLDCLADRLSIGVITGEMLAYGKPRDMSFQRKTGYVQQQDFHLHTSTVREALRFSAILRQPHYISRDEKLSYVEKVINILDMNEYADAVVGVSGEGLNIEQRKRLTIGVELAARPPLLIFVDEPTSGLDSQTSWAILDLMEKLSQAGQAVLCTIHQPSAALFQRFGRLLLLTEGGKTVYQRFGRLLLLTEGGKTVYFGDIGDNSDVMTSYFERYSGHSCPPEANPAEWMMQVIATTPGSATGIDWFKTWRESPEYSALQVELDGSKNETAQHPPSQVGDDPDSCQEFAAPFVVQLRENLARVFQQYWRTPTYIYSKIALCTLISLFIGFIFFQAPNSIQGLQSQMFAIFNMVTIFGQLVQQIIPQFVIQRSLYEARERPSKTYSWKVFMLSQIIVELPWNSLMAVLMYFCWYYPVGLYRNAEADGRVVERGLLVFLFLLMFMIYAGTFSTLVISGLDTVQAGGNLADLLFNLCLIFCGVLATPETLPRFWIFLYRVSPFTYMIGGVLPSAVANTNIICAENELLAFKPTNGSTCGSYLDAYMRDAGGYLIDSDNATDCRYCPMSSTNSYLESVSMTYADRWRNFGILWIYVLFNIFGSLLIYKLVRVPKRKMIKRA